MAEARLRLSQMQPVADPGKIKLVVLPFDNLSADAEQEYFSDGMTEEMIAQMGRLQPERLGVIARTSAMKYKGTKKGIDQIRQELGVDYILEGSVRRAGERVRIAVQLIQVSDQTQLWAESYDRDMGDLFVIQSEVARRIARSLAVELLPAQQQAAQGRVSTTNPEAYEAYLKGRYFWNKRTGNDLKKAIKHFQEAIKKDSNYALAYAGLAQCYALLPEYVGVPSSEAFPEAKVLATKALEIDDTIAEAHSPLAYIRCHYDWDWSGAERQYQRAIELDPNYATAYQSYSSYLQAMGRHEEAISAAKRALELDPVSLSMSNTLAMRLALARQYDQAIEQAHKTLDMEPNSPVAYFSLGLSYLQKGMHDKAIAAFQKRINLGGEGPDPLAGLGYAYAVSSRRAEALEILDKLKKYASPVSMALVFVGLGDKEQAFAWLEKAYKERDRSMVGLKIFPLMDSLRSDPRFEDLLRRVGLAR